MFAFTVGIVNEIIIMTFVADVCTHRIMDEDDVIAISNYLSHGAYPKGFTRDDKRSLRQKSTSFVCQTGLYCVKLVLCFVYVIQIDLQATSISCQFQLIKC